MQPDAREIAHAVDLALAEDLGGGDLTTDSLIPREARATASIVAREGGVLAGMPLANAVFLRLDPSLTIGEGLVDGQRFEADQTIARLEGSAAAILRGERVALNFLQRLSGIATLTARYVQAVGDLPVSVIDTRKTTPGLRALEKYAVRVGGGRNHRFNLMDGVLVKDNHLALLRAGEVSLEEAVRRLREAVPHTLKVEVEVESEEEALAAADAGADVLLLDNMDPAEMARVAEALRDRVLLEASGGITLENVRQVAQTGVHLISVGALTHSARSLNLSLDLTPA